ncbi:MAG: flagellar basal-body MS-ring/collar protein FliF, partial [bacterium]
MFEWLDPYKKQFRELWEKLDTRARIIIGAVLVAIVFFMIFMVFMTGGTQYTTLFSNLTARDANSIVQRLEESNISYQLEDNGRTIQVGSDVVHNVRLEMAGEGLPSQGVVGFEIFDQSSFGTTDFERQVNFYRALGGELSRSIQGITAVEYARVQITAPKESIFVQEEQPAEASVLLKIIPGYSLNQSQVRAISNLVASSVQGLEDNNVTVVDTDGNLLTSNIDQENNSYSDQHTMRQFEIESEFANGLKQDLRTVLSRVLGPDNYTLQVKAKLNFDQREVESKEYSPVVGDEGIARSREEH